MLPPKENPSKDRMKQFKKWRGSLNINNYNIGTNH